MGRELLGMSFGCGTAFVPYGIGLGGMKNPCVAGSEIFSVLSFDGEFGHLFCKSIGRKAQTFTPDNVAIFAVRCFY